MRTRARDAVELAESTYQRVVADVQPQLDRVLAAVTVAEQRERDERDASERAERTRKTVAAVRALDDALSAVFRAERELRAVLPDAPGSFTSDVARSREVFTNWAKAIGALD